MNLVRHVALLRAKKDCLLGRYRGRGNVLREEAVGETKRNDIRCHQLFYGVRRAWL
jgi:hypothetical protein